MNATNRLIPYFWLIPVIALCHALLPSTALTEGINFRSDQKYTNSSSETKIKTTGETIDNDFYRYDQLYDLGVSKTIYPYLSFNAGAVYEHNKATSTTGDLETDTTEKILRPFTELNLNNPIYQAGIAYRKRRRELEITDTQDTRTDRDEITTVLGMNPDPIFPSWDARFSHIHTYDDPETEDKIDKLFTFDTGYSVWNSLVLDYFYSYNELEDRLLDFTTEQQNHFGKLDYSNQFFDRRLALNTGYRIRYQTLKFPSSAVVESPLSRSAGLSSLDNTPTNGPALDVNNALIDGNLVASAGLNLGTGGDQAQLVNIGLDFGLAVDVDIIHIWVDRNLTATVADSFSWSVYTSPNNRDTSTWTLAATVSPADFGTFDNRFEISFPVVNTRFIKVVTGALSPTDPGALDFPDIFVTEMQAFITLSGVEVDNKQTTIDHNYNLNLRAKLGNKSTLGYNLLYSQQDVDPSSDKRTELTNALFFRHNINDVFSFRANGQRADTSVTDEDTTTYNYGGALLAKWLGTFNQSLTYNGIYEELPEGTAFQNSVFLRNNADLYPGWSVSADAGYSWEEPVTGERINSRIIRGSTNLEPHETITLNANYSYKRTDQSGLDIGPRTETEYDIQAFYNPFSNLSLFGRINVVERDNSRNTFQNYSINWSPFPDGDLQFFFVYTETLRSSSDQRDTLIGPGLKWAIGRHISADMSYNYTRNESTTLKTESNIFNSELNFVF